VSEWADVIGPVMFILLFLCLAVVIPNWLDEAHGMRRREIEQRGWRFVPPECEDCGSVCEAGKPHDCDPLTVAMSCVASSVDAYSTGRISTEAGWLVSIGDGHDHQWKDAEDDVERVLGDDGIVYRIAGMRCLLCGSYTTQRRRCGTWTPDA
jgi:hypothetical protein